MPVPVPAPLRQRLVELASRGPPLSAIATALDLPYHTVRHLWRRYRDHGPPGLLPDSRHCGRRASAECVALLARA